MSGGLYDKAWYDMGRYAKENVHCVWLQLDSNPEPLSS